MTVVEVIRLDGKAVFVGGGGGLYGKQIVVVPPEARSGESSSAAAAMPHSINVPRVG